MIIAVDFDGTLANKGEPNIVLIKRLIAEQRRGNTVILWTCRQNQSLVDALEFLARYGFRPNLVNRNTPEIVRRQGDSRKIYADIYIDDKAVR